MIEGKYYLQYNRVYGDISYAKIIYENGVDSLITDLYTKTSIQTLNYMVELYLQLAVL